MLKVVPVVLTATFTWSSCSSALRTSKKRLRDTGWFVCVTHHGVDQTVDGSRRVGRGSGGRSAERAFCQRALTGMPRFVWLLCRPWSSLKEFECSFEERVRSCRHRGVSLLLKEVHHELARQCMWVCKLHSCCVSNPRNIKMETFSVSVGETQKKGAGATEEFHKQMFLVTKVSQERNFKNKWELLEKSFWRGRRRLW